MPVFSVSGLRRRSAGARSPVGEQKLRKEARLARIAVIPGDGIGIEVTQAAMQVTEAVAAAFDIPLELEWFDYGADVYLKTGVGLNRSRVRIPTSPPYFSF